MRVIVVEGNMGDALICGFILNLDKAAQLYGRFCYYVNFLFCISYTPYGFIASRRIA